MSWQSGIIAEVNYDKAYIRIRVDEQYKYYTFMGEERQNKDVLSENNIFLSKEDDKYGFIDKQGNTVVDYIYDDATEQNAYGYVAVKKDGVWGSIDKNGKVAQEPIYNLDNSFIISFIGKWYAKSDVNVIFYTKEEM